MKYHLFLEQFHKQHSLIHIKTRKDGVELDDLRNYIGGLIMEIPRVDKSQAPYKIVYRYPDFNYHLIGVDLCDVFKGIYLERPLPSFDNKSLIDLLIAANNEELNPNEWKHNSPCTDEYTTSEIKEEILRRMNANPIAG